MVVGHRRKISESTLLCAPVSHISVLHHHCFTNVLCIASAGARSALPYCSLACCSSGSGAYLPGSTSGAFSAAVQKDGRGRWLARVFLPASYWSGRTVRPHVSTSLFCKNLRSAGLAAAGPSRAELELDILCQNTHADHSFVASDCFQKKTVSKKFVRGFEGRRAGSEPALRKRSRPAGCLQHLPPLLYSASLRSTPKLDCYWARHKKVSVLQYSVLRCFRSLQCPGR